mmetsp:Transcript_11832/g.43248  ORF Transcript_11832/g.43248 Transcript_11832/m.43248 type:complete len:218 (+) Transcript_11832:576-1229(+)
MSDLSTSTMPFLISFFLITSFFPFSAMETDWPAQASLTATRLVKTDFARTSLKAPVLSGPRSNGWLLLIVPESIVPATTVPTPVTMKLSSNWHLTGDFTVSHPLREGRQFRNCRSKSKFLPDTQETKKIGATFSAEIDFAHVNRSSLLRTKYGSFRTPGRLSSFMTEDTVCFRICSLHASILVMTTNTGTFKASVIPKCSLVIPTIPPLLPSTTSIT